MRAEIHLTRIRFYPHQRPRSARIDVLSDSCIGSRARKLDRLQIVRAHRFNDVRDDGTRVLRQDRRWNGGEHTHQPTHRYTVLAHAFSLEGLA